MKNSYILLRNNKESAALSIEELQEIGLKETDLIWVECQSMDWRSPFEITELKNLVSAGNNEDKKNVGEKLISREVTNHDSLVKKKGPGKIWTNTHTRNLEKYSHPEHIIIPSLKEETVFPIYKSDTSTETEVTDIANPQQGELRNKSTFAIQLPGGIRKIAVYTGLVLTGALLMWLKMNLGSKRPAVVQQTKALPVKSAVPNPGSVKAINDTSTIAASNITEPESPAEKNSVTSIKEQKRRVTATNNMLPQTDATIAASDSSNNKNEKNTKPVSDVVIKPVTIADISSKIALETNDYHVGAMGGIRNLKMTLQNGSGYLLDKVTVELKYLNPDGNIIKTDQLYFQNVGPQDAAVLDIDKSKRGVKVEYKITNIECKAINSLQPGLADHSNHSTN
ncbi:MAG: hypothetical protein ACRDE5_05460 [Ginsengibacter sp.]